MSIPGRSLRAILPSLALLAIAFLGACGKEETPAPVALEPSASALTLQTPRLQGLSLNGRSVEDIAASFQDTQTLEARDLSQAFGISDTAYLDGVMKLIEAQLTSGNPLKLTSIYFGGALKSQALRCIRDLGEGICMVEPYVFNCAEAVPQKNWTEENYLKLCRRLGRLKAYRPERLFAVFEGQDVLAYRESPAPPPLPTPGPEKGKKPAPQPTPSPTASLPQLSWHPHPESVDLVRYLQREGIAVFARIEPLASSSLQSWGFAIPPSRIGETGKDSSAWKLLASEVAERNLRAIEASAKLNLEDLRLVLWVSSDFDPAQPADLAFLENASSVPGGADLLLVHPYLRGNDKNLSHEPRTGERFQAFIARQAALRPTRLGQWLEQPAVVKNVSGSPGGFLKEVPAAGAAVPEAVSTETQASPEAQAVGSPTPVPASPAPAATPSPPQLEPIPPAPPDPKRDAME